MRSKVANDFCLRVIRDHTEINEIRGMWSAWHQHPNSDVDFYQTVIRSLHGVLRPHIIVLYLGNIPKAMLIGRLERAHINFRIGYKNLLKTKARLLTFIYKGFLGEVSLENAELLLREIIKSLNRKEADAAFLSNVGVDSPLYRLGKELPGFLERDHAVAANIHRSMNLPDNFDEVYSGLSGKVRKNLKWQAKKLATDFSGSVEIRAFQGTNQLEEMIRDLEQVAKKTYQRGLGVGFIDSVQTRERLKLEAAMGWLRSFILYIHQKPCAFWKGTLYQRTFYSDCMGYDPDYRKYSPGMYLIMKVIEDFCGMRNGERPREIDFGFGDAQYKAVLANRGWYESSVYMFAPTLKGVGINLLRTPMELVNQRAKHFLSHRSLLLRVKRMWREQVSKS